jgi:endonuclease IV
VRHIKHCVLIKELDLTQCLGFTHLIMHSGSVKGALNKKEKINAVVRVLNTLL